MGILIVDPSLEERQKIYEILCSAGYKDIFFAETTLVAFKLLEMDNPVEAPVDIDLIILDNISVKTDGIFACQRIKENKNSCDIPIIIISPDYNMEDLKAAVSAGALYYTQKPPNEIELLVLVQSALKVKEEKDKRKQREEELLQVTRQLEEANENLRKLSFLDGLTGIANRRRFDEVLQNEWMRAKRVQEPISLIFIDIDFFKKYNDTYGHLTGDDCLKKVAASLQAKLRRPADLAARYGGEEFAVILPNTGLSGALGIAETLRCSVEKLSIPHATSTVSNSVTVSAGVSSIIPQSYNNPEELVASADKALYLAKQKGRNMVYALELEHKGTQGDRFHVLI